MVQNNKERLLTVDGLKEDELKKAIVSLKKGLLDRIQINYGKSQYRLYFIIDKNMNVRCVFNDGESDDSFVLKSKHIKKIQETIISMLKA